jgi:hypothetical protein
MWWRLFIERAEIGSGLDNSLGTPGHCCIDCLFFFFFFLYIKKKLFYYYYFSFYVRHVRREANKAANLLAKNVLMTMEDIV